jgi:hypothetical protein
LKSLFRPPFIGFFGGNTYIFYAVSTHVPQLILQFCVCI